jgi:hypothetical protein
MDFFLYCSAIWFFFYLVNYAGLFEPIREAAMPALPTWLQTLLQCALCFTWWVTLGFSLFVGFSVTVFAAPPCVLFADMIYRKLNGSTDTQPPLLK